MTRTRWLLLSLLVALLASVGIIAVWRRPVRVAVDVGTVTMQPTFRSSVTASGEIVATRYADIGSNVMGTVVSLPVSEGDHVRRGQLLAQIDPVQAQSDASGAGALVEALEADMRAAAEQSAAASADIEAATARLRDAETQLTRTRTLTSQGLAATATLDAASTAADIARAQVTAARAGLARAGQARAAAERRVAQARAQQVRARDIVAKTSILAPMEGVVTRLGVRQGEMVVVGVQNQPGTTLMTISDLGGIDAEVKAAEADVLRLAPGQPATVTLEALPGRRFRGRVVDIGASALPVAGTGAAAREFKVVVRLDEPDASLRPGMTADVEVTTAERTNVLTVPLQSVVVRPQAGGSDEQSGVFIVREERASFQPVTTGVIGGLDIEVTGIPGRTSVVVGPYQALRELRDGALVTTTPPKP